MREFVLARASRLPTKPAPPARGARGETGERLAGRGGDHGIGQVALGLLEGDDALLDGSLRHHLVHVHLAVLSDAVGTVGRLVGGGGVPPGVGVHHHRGAREVQPRTAGLQRHEEDRRLIVVEGVHETHALALGRGARYGEMPDTATVKLGGKHVQIARELRENEHLAPSFHGLVHQFHDGAQLLGAALVVLEHERRVERDLAQARQFGQHLDGALLRIGNMPAAIGPRGVLPLLGVQILAQALLGAVVEPALLAAERHIADTLELGGQISEHVGLAAAQHKRLDERAQACGRLFVLADNAQLVALAEPLVAAEEPRHEEVEDAPELREAVLHRRAREREPQTGAQTLHGASGLGGVVLDVLGLVEHHQAPFDTRELRAIDAHAVVGGHDHARDIGARSASDSLASRSRVLARIVPAPENAPFVYPLRRTE